MFLSHFETPYHGPRPQYVLNNSLSLLTRHHLSQAASLRNAGYVLVLDSGTGLTAFRT